MSPSAEEPITLKEVQLRLGVPQHVLIHLCEKGVIVPDFAETSGRGKRREFSRRNLFEFGVALAIRAFDVPVATTAFVVRLLRSFERATGKVVEGFELLPFVTETGGEIELNLFDGRTLVFGARGGGLAKPLLLAVELDPSADLATARPRVSQIDQLPTTFEGRLQLRLKEIAKRITE